MKRLIVVAVTGRNLGKMTGGVKASDLTCPIGVTSAAEHQGQKAYFSPTLSAQYWMSLNVSLLSNGVVPSARTGR